MSAIPSTRFAPRPSTDRRRSTRSRPISAPSPTRGTCRSTAFPRTMSEYTDRQAIGTELRYFRPGLTFVGLVDYDIHFGDLNDVLLLATAALPARWTMSANLDHRKSPGLSLQQCADRPACQDVRRAVRPLFQRPGRAIGQGSQRRVGHVHGVAVAAVRRAMAVVDGRVGHQRQRDTSIGRGRGDPPVRART